MQKNLLILPIALVGLLLLFGCIQPPVDNQTSIDFETIEQGPNSNLQDRGAYVITSQEKWQSFWNSTHSNQDPIPSLPQIDFSKETIVAVFMGGRSTGGYAIEISSIQLIEGNPPQQIAGTGSVQGQVADHIRVNFKETSPNPGDIVTQATTSPYHIVKIPKQSTNNYFFTDGKTTPLPIIDFELTTIETIWLSVSPKQCNSNPWDNISLVPDGTGGIKGTSETIEQYKIVEFLKSKNIAVLDYSQRQSAEIVCEACSCPKGNEIFVKISANDKTAIEAFGFTQVSQPIIFTDKLAYNNEPLNCPPCTSEACPICDVVYPKIKITIINPLNESIFLEGCNQYGYYKLDSRLGAAAIPEVKPFKVCVWEGNAYQIKAGEKAEFEEELLPATQDFEQYFLTTGYSTQCNESILPKPISQLNCAQTTQIDSLGFRVIAAE